MRMVLAVVAVVVLGAGCGGEEGGVDEGGGGAGTGGTGGVAYLAPGEDCETAEQCGPGAFCNGICYVGECGSGNDCPAENPHCVGRNDGTFETFCAECSPSAVGACDSAGRACDPETFTCTGCDLVSCDAPPQDRCIDNRGNCCVPGQCDG